MAYCTKCGAYIPDNMTGCLACGFDAATAAAQAQQEENDRAAAEERRRRQQEADRKWAEAEYNNRKRQQENAERWAEAEAVRRRREEEARQRWEDEKARRAAMERDNRSYSGTYNTRYCSYKTTSVSTTRNTPYEAKRVVNKTIGNNNGLRKLMNVISYINLLFLVPMILCKDDKSAQFHASQGLRLFVFNAITTALTAIFPPAGLLKLFSLYCFIKGVGNALNDVEVPLPYIGDFKF